MLMFVNHPLPTDSPQNTGNMVVQFKFLEKQLEKLKNPLTADKVTSDLYRVRDTLTSLSNLRVFMATDVHQLPSPLEPWQMFVQKATSPR